MPTLSNSNWRPPPRFWRTRDFPIRGPKRRDESQKKPRAGVSKGQNNCIGGFDRYRRLVHFPRFEQASPSSRATGSPSREVLPPSDGAPSEPPNDVADGQPVASSSEIRQRTHPRFIVA